MNKHYSLLPALFLIAFVAQRSTACGYDWISDCSSQVHLRINGAVDSFILADCPFGFPFDGVQIGSIQSIALANAKAITWESCQNNVSAVRLRYRLYEQGFPGGAWQTFDLQEYQQTVQGPYTTRYRQHPDNLLLSGGLTVGKSYTIELYLVAEVDTIGDDFIPETSLLRNNNGANYKLSFVYGGPTAPPMALLAHKKDPVCHGSNNGLISVSVYGNQTGLFYQWSNISLNFFQQNSLPPGTYSITVTNSLGHMATQTVTLIDPPAIQVQFTNVQSVGCNNSPGSATAAATGGTPPYHFLWYNGQQNPVISLPAPGNWPVTVTDARGCTGAGTVSIGNSGQVERSVSAHICQGETYSLGGQVFNATGQYQFVTPGGSGCDTLNHLSLAILDPAVALTGLPASVDLSCAMPESTVCLSPAVGVQLSWLKDGIQVSVSNCYVVQGPGIYKVIAQQEQCVAEAGLNVTGHFAGIHSQVAGQVLRLCSGYQPAWLVAHTDAQTPSIQWWYNGGVVATGDSCFFQIVEMANGVPLLPSLSVTDAYGCTGTVVEWQIQWSADTLAPVISAGGTDASSSQAHDGSAHVEILSGQGPFAVDWNTGATGPEILQLGPGVYCATVTGSNGCSAGACATVSFPMAAGEPLEGALHIQPNPAEAGSTVQLTSIGAFESGTLTLGIWDTAGRLAATVVSEPTGGDQYAYFRLPPTLLPGVYFIGKKDAERHFAEKLVVR